jgi:hypothetical protein
MLRGSVVMPATPAHYPEMWNAYPYTLIPKFKNVPVFSPHVPDPSANRARPPIMLLLFLVKPHESTFATAPLAAFSPGYAG